MPRATPSTTTGGRKPAAVLDADELLRAGAKEGVGDPG